jgi:hypothetical protein
MLAIVGAFLVGVLLGTCFAMVLFAMGVTAKQNVQDMPETPLRTPKFVRREHPGCLESSQRMALGRWV